MNAPRALTISRLLRRPRVLGRLRRLDRASRMGGGPILHGNEVIVYTSGRATFEAMIGEIGGATKSVALEMYAWADDRLGRRFADAVAARAREGLTVCVLLDAFGSLASGSLAASMVKAGVRVLWYHPLAPWAPRWSPNHRDHRKLILVDGATGFAGGMNFAESYTEEFSGEEAWLDASVRVRGPAVREMVRMFIETWMRAGGALDEVGALIGTAGEQGDAVVQVAGGRGVLGRRRLRRAYLSQIALAQRRVFLANAYFVPELSLRRALRGAARRGVRMDLLLPEKTDVPMVRWAGRAWYGTLLEAGCRIREVPRTILHAKLAVFDDEVLLTGSANLDHRSFRHNLEIAVNVFERGAAQAAMESYEREFEAAREITLDGWRRRPAREKLLERLASLFTYWL
jgi:cardiolipin synthase